MEGKKSIVVLGSLNMDLVMTTPRMPAAGETMHGTSFDTHPGGKGLNQAIAAQRLLHNTGWKTYMIGRVGQDEFADRLKVSLDEEGVDVSEVKPSSGKTSGVALIIVEENSGQNRIILSAHDANSSFKPADVDAISPIIQSAAVLICQLEIPLETVERAFSIAHSFSIPTIFNPAPAIPHLPHSLYRKVDYLIPNESEAEILLGSKFRIEDVAAALDGAVELMNRGVRKAVIITLGKEGVVIVKRDGQMRTFPARKVDKVVDTTGAGDCFVAGFAVGLVERGLAVEGAAHIGLAAAALAIQKHGASTSMPHRYEMAWGGH